MSIRWGICGAGKISHDFVVGLKTRPTAEHSVVAVSARSVESAAEFAALHHVERHYGSYEELAVDQEVGRLGSILFWAMRISLSVV